MNEQELSNKEYFPKFILLRRMAKGGDDEGNSQQWQGLVKEIKSNTRQSQKQLQSDIIQELAKNKLDHEQRFKSYEEGLSV